MNIFVLFLIKAVIATTNVNDKQDNRFRTENADFVIELTDEKWDQVQKGRWLIGFFDRESAESTKLENDWQTFALKCKEFNINVGRVFAPYNPGLLVRFLVTIFPKVFYVKNGVAHEVSNVNRNILIELIKEEKLNQLKPVSFMSNPFSVQMSLLSHLFIHAVNLYNFENSIVQKFVSFQSATDVVFGLTFIIVGTFLGLLLSCAFQLLQIFLMDSKEKTEEAQLSDEDEEEEEVKDLSEESKSIRKRK